MSLINNTYITRSPEFPADLKETIEATAGHVVITGRPRAMFGAKEDRFFDACPYVEGLECFVTTRL